MRARVARRVHQLNSEVEPLSRRIRLADGDDVLLAQDRHCALDHQACALIVVGDDALADDDAFARFEFDLQRH
jgi:hypothetical protein